MLDNNTTLWVSIISASSALSGVVITQIITAINNRASDKRKHHFEIVQRKIEVGEHYYRVTGDNLRLVDATIHTLTKLPVLIKKKISPDVLISKSLDEILSNNKKISEAYPLGSFINLYYNVSENFDSNSRFGIILKDLGIDLITSFPKPREFAEDVREEKIAEEVKEQKLLELANYLEPIIKNLEKQKEEFKANMEIVRNEINDLKI